MWQSYTRDHVGILLILAHMEPIFGTVRVCLETLDYSMPVNSLTTPETFCAQENRSGSVQINLSAENSLTTTSHRASNYSQKLIRFHTTSEIRT